MKTAMELMIEMLEVRKVNYKGSHWEDAYDSILATSAKLFEMEKEQIIHAYRTGMLEYEADIPESNFNDWAMTYHFERYNKEQNG